MGRMSKTPQILLFMFIACEGVLGSQIQVSQCKTSSEMSVIHEILHFLLTLIWKEHTVLLKYRKKIILLISAF